MIKHGGKHPIWNESFQLSLNSIKDRIVITCYDKDLFNDDIIGTTTIFAWNLSHHKMETKGWIPINWEGKRAGHVKVETKYVSVEDIQPINVPLYDENFMNVRIIPSNDTQV